jgi:hypothetical protein
MPSRVEALWHHASLAADHRECAAMPTIQLPPPSGLIIALPAGR